jgi:anti-sigma B factor antagonist
VFVLAAGAPIQIAISAVAASDCLAPNLLRKRRVPIHVPPHTEIVDYEHGDAPGLTVRGEIDIATSPQLELALDKAIRDSTGAFVLDLSELEFLDSSGLNLMLRVRAALARERRTLAIVCPPGPVRRVIEIARLDELLLVYDSHTDRAAALIPSD